uniref:Uncharacterized protein n=1 Tax=Bactrocera dorsalis TaxID=27457 RepID=A0A034V6L0_BACDO
MRRNCSLVPSTKTATKEKLRDKLKAIRKLAGTVLLKDVVEIRLKDLIFLIYSLYNNNNGPLIETVYNYNHFFRTVMSASYTTLPRTKKSEKVIGATTKTRSKTQSQTEK